MSVMTEVEASTKWCPFMQVSMDGDGARIATNRGHILVNKEKTNLKCIGSECMVWRATPEIKGGLDGEKIIKEAGGYCGLAGKP